MKADPFEWRRLLKRVARAEEYAPKEDSPALRIWEYRAYLKAAYYSSSSSVSSAVSSSAAKRPIGNISIR